MIESNKNVDVIIVGGSYAGLSAAMALGRALKKVLIIDSGNPCNKQTPQSHNFLTQDGMAPAAISAIGLVQVLQYPTVQLVKDIAVDVIGSDGNFTVTTDGGASHSTKKILFATGVKDIMPEIPGFAECWGISVIHCPYCHGYEYSGKATGILLNGDVAAEMALMISNWTNTLTIFTNGASKMSVAHQKWLTNKGIKLIENEIKAIEHIKGKLQRVLFTDGSSVELEALYARPAFTQQATIPQIMGCTIADNGYIVIDDFKRTNIAGVFAAGDNTTPMRSVAGAVASGNFAGVVISKDLFSEANVDFPLTK